MTAIGKPERATQDRVLRLFQHELGYTYLGDWSERADNSNIEEGRLRTNLLERGYHSTQIERAIYQLKTQANNPQRTLYTNNREVYNLLRYGVPVKTDASTPNETVHIIDWQHPEANDFAIVEEVTLRGERGRRPDIVLYINGIAIAVLELKNSRVSIGDGIRQNISNQQPEFHAWFFSTIQFLFAGNDTEGLKYGTIGTPDKYFLNWKEDEADDTRYKLDKYLLKLCNKTRLLELIHDFIIFDGGVKKLPRPHQYFGIKAAQAHVQQRKGGIIWHTQGSGKSIVMVLLAKWILETNPHARVAIITDRDELDRQIEGVFQAASTPMERATSGRDLLAKLRQPTPRLFCSLVHKFGRRGVDDLDSYLDSIRDQPPTTHGELFVFVDECHRTQTGKLHHLMKAILPDAVFIGFTGTPLLKEDRATSLEVFGGYIHTYKFSEAVDDTVVLDLVYEARDIDQRLSSPQRVDAWFENRTRGLNAWRRTELQRHWGTMQKVQSSSSRMARVIADIQLDFATRPRLSDGRGNAMLVAASIYDACRYYDMFQRTEFKGECAIITSYNPQAQDITLEDTGSNTETERQLIYNTYITLLREIVPAAGMSKTETYEQQAKHRFIHEPATMKLLIVVDKLLTGFDAPPCTYLYIDKSMQDHGLFQAICRTNRLDGEDKTVGYIVDYKDLFKRVKDAIAVYTSELDHSTGGVDPEVLLRDRLHTGRERLNAALEALILLCEPVAPPKDELAYIRYFCGNTDIPTDLENSEPQRVALYRSTVGLLRAYAAIADDLASAGYSENDIAMIREQLAHYLALRDTIRQASGENLDLKPYEADMRHLIDTYIHAEDSQTVTSFGDRGMLDIIASLGIHEAIRSLPQRVQPNESAVAEIIENNVRKTIIRGHSSDPAYYERMSTLLDELIADRKARAIEYAAYLQQIAALAQQVTAGYADTIPAELKQSPAIRALYNNLKAFRSSADSQNRSYEEQESYDTGPIDEQALQQAIAIDAEVKRVRSDDWRGISPRERVIQQAIYGILHDVTLVERIFMIIKAQHEY